MSIFEVINRLLENVNIFGNKQKILIIVKYICLLLNGALVGVSSDLAGIAGYTILVKTLPGRLVMRLGQCYGSFLYS